MNSTFSFLFRSDHDIDDEKSILVKRMAQIGEEFEKAKELTWWSRLDKQKDLCVEYSAISERCRKLDQITKKS